MCAQTTRLSNRELKAIKPKNKDYILTDRFSGPAPLPSQSTPKTTPLSKTP
jgi:hypothetical protein